MIHVSMNFILYYVECFDSTSSAATIILVENLESLSSLRSQQLYLLKHKTKVTKTLKNLCYSIKQKFGVNIQGFRTHNAKNFYNNKLREFFDSEGIWHETSCTYTPQHNGLVEKKIGE